MGKQPALRVAEIQARLQTAGLDGWLFCDFRRSDPLAYRILGVENDLIATRRWYYWIPATGEPVKIVHAIEQGNLDALPGSRKVYLPWKQLHDILKETLVGARQVAMQYSPMNAVPYLSRVDAGTVELIRSFGTEVVSSGDLVSQFESVWTDKQWESHKDASLRLMSTLKETYIEIVRRMAQGEECTEYRVQEYMMEIFDRKQIVTDHPPIVAVGPNAANPHYSPTASQHTPLKKGDLLLIDFWGRVDGEDTVCADYTWMASVDTQVSDRVEKIFQIVRQARDAGIERVRSAFKKEEEVFGRDVDDSVRKVIEDAGYGDAFLHRTGHSIGREVHGNGANIDNLETQDDRRLLPSTCFSIEPGIYLAGDIGFRSEVDVYITPECEVVVTGDPIQDSVIPLLSAYAS